MLKQEAGFPIPVVRLIIPDQSGKVLILRRSKKSTYATGEWNLPGGKVDYGRTAEEDVRKELMEETALECASTRFLFYQDSLPLKPGGMHCINLYFECAVRGSIRLNEESSQYAWVGPDDMKKYKLTFRNDEGLLRYWNEAQKR